MNHLPENSLKVGNDVTSSPEAVNLEKFVSYKNEKHSRVNIIVH